MTVREARRSFVYTCDRCDEAVFAQETLIEDGRPPSWSKLVWVDPVPVHFYSPTATCASTDTRILCQPCAVAVRRAINDAMNAVSEAREREKEDEMRRKITEAERKAASEAMKAFQLRTRKSKFMGVKKKPATVRRIPAQPHHA